MADSEERAREAWRKWHAAHKEELNAKRREKYRENKEYRQKAIEQSRQTRRKISAEGVSEEPTYRMLNGVRVEVFKVGQVAELAGVAPQTLRKWSDNGTIPPSIFPGRHRLYTRPQVNLIRRIAQAAKANRYDYQALRTEMTAAKAEAYKHWNQGVGR